MILRVGELKPNGHLNADKIELPEGATLITDPDTSSHAARPAAEIEVTPVGGDGSEPEVIKRKTDEEGPP